MISTILFSALAASAEARNVTFDHKSVALNGSLYQSTYLDGHVFATSSVGRVVNESYIFKVDANSLELVETVTPERDNKTGMLWAVYAAAHDEKNKHVWFTNTRLNTVSAYDTDLKLVSHLPVNTTQHSRDVLIDEKTGKAYVTGLGTGISVYDANALKHEGWIELQTQEQKFKTTMELVLDSAKQVLYTVSLASNVAAAVDLSNNNKVTYYQLGNASRASGVAYDTKRSHLYVVSQGTDELLVVDTNEGANPTSKSIQLPSTLSKRAAHDDVSTEIKVEDGNLYAGYEAKNDLVYVVNRLEAEVYVIDPETEEVITTLKTGKNPNHVAFDPSGNAWVTDKDTPTRLHRFSLVSNSDSGNSSSSASGSHGGAGASASGHHASGSGAAAATSGKGGKGGPAPSGSAAAASGKGGKGGPAPSGSAAAASGKGGKGGSAPAANGASHLLAGAGVALLPALSLLI